MNNTAYFNGVGDVPGALVVIFLRGGADGLSMAPPLEDDAYYAARPQLAIQPQDAIPLDGLFGLNARLGPLHKLYSSGEMLAVQGVGSEDETRSHFEAQDFMEHGGMAAGGWLGRYLRAAKGEAGGALAAVAIGKYAPECLRGAPATLVMESLKDLSFGESSDAFLDVLGPFYAEAPGALGAAGRDIAEGMRRLRALETASYVPENGAAYPKSAFGQGLREIAQLLKARVGVRAATLDLDGWDAHFASPALMNPLMDTLAHGLAAFTADLESQMASTTVVVMTEFGRRVAENASFGTDHGRGGMMLVIGGGVAGGRVLHDWKGLQPENLDGPGDVPVQFNYRDVLAPCLARHGGEAAPGGAFPDYAIAPVTLYG